MMNTNLEHSDQVNAEDITFLENFFGKVNSKYFHGKLQTHVLWSIPVASNAVTSFSSNESLDSEPEKLNILKLAIARYAEGNTSEAKKLALRLVDSNDSRVFELLIHCDKKTGGDWQKWAELRNQGAGDIALQACSCTESINGMNVIRIHPRLAPSLTKKVPKYVHTYILRHEGLHQILKTTPEEPHPPEFIAEDNKYDKKEMALSHIERLGFSVI